jgi:hypothetical protein
MINSTKSVDRFLEVVFLTYGVPAFAYVKTVKEGGHVCFEIHGADGSLLGTADDRAAACAACGLNDLEFMSVH